MQLLAREVAPGTAIRQTVGRARHELSVWPALERFFADVCSERRRRAHDLVTARKLEQVESLVDGALVDTAADGIETFERVLNGCLDAGYREPALFAFLFTVLRPRLESRIRRRLLRSGRGGSVDDIADLVSVASESIHRLIVNASREQYTLRYVMLLSIADHRTIDYLRRPRPEVRASFDDHAATPEESVPGWHGSFAAHTPEAQLVKRERRRLAHRLREAVFHAVNALEESERAALLMVEIEGAGYPEVAQALGIKQTDVGNMVRRARLKRDRLLVPLLRDIPGLEGHVGFSELQTDKALRLHMVRWSSTMGQGICPDCQRVHRHLHAAEVCCAATAMHAEAG